MGRVAMYHQAELRYCFHGFGLSGILWSVQNQCMTLCDYCMSVAFINNINGDCCVALVLVGRELIMVVRVIPFFVSLERSSIWNQVKLGVGTHEGGISVCLAIVYRDVNISVTIECSCNLGCL
jgi:hypothetical protein